MGVNVEYDAISLFFGRFSARRTAENRATIQFESQSCGVNI